MSEKRRGENIRAVSWLGPLVGLVLALAIAWFIGFVGGQQRHEAETAYRYTESAKAAAQRECVGIEPTRVFDCVAEKVENSRQTIHDAKDLKAQQQSAWAGLLGSVWSLGALFATVMGLIWIKGTLDATREAVRQTIKSNDEMEKQTAIAEDTAKRQLRAYVYPVGVNMEWVIYPATGKFCRLSVIVRNSGNSPTRRLYMPARYSTQLEPEGQFSAITCPNEEFQVSPLGGGQEIETAPVTIPEEIVYQVFRGETSIFVFGGIFYDDIFNESHLTRFCLQINFEMSSDVKGVDRCKWAFSGPHNCSDEECPAEIVTECD